MRFLTTHWDLKLVALVLAVALWTYTSGQVRSDRTLDVDLRPDQIGGLGGNYQIASISPEQFRVTLSVPSNRWSMMPANDQLTPRLEVRQGALPRRTQEFAVSSAMLGLPSDIRIVRTEPENLRSITLRWNYITASELPALRPPLVNLPPGLEAEVRLNVDHVSVRATEDVLERERGSHVRFQPIDLSGEDIKAAATRTFTVQLRPADDLPYTVVSPPIATVQLRPVPAGRQTSPLPVRVLMPPGAGLLHISVVPARVQLTVHGPENLLRELRPEDEITAYVDLHQLPAGAADTQDDLAVSLLAPAWLTWDPMQVHVTITAGTPAASAPAPATEPSSVQPAAPAPAPAAPAPTPTAAPAPAPSMPPSTSTSAPAQAPP